MSHQIKLFKKISPDKHSSFDSTLFPIQTHSNNIIEVITGEENTDNSDGLITSKDNIFSLGIKTADCAAICFYDENSYGIIHAGWRGLVNGIIEKMLDKFNNPKVFVSPLLPEFEIKKDACYEQIHDKFGEKYFSITVQEDNPKIVFQFHKCLQSLLPGNTVFDNQDTFSDSSLASWRRDNTNDRNLTIISNLFVNQQATFVKALD